MKPAPVKMVPVPLDVLSRYLDSSAKNWQDNPTDRAMLVAAVKAAKK